MFKVEIFRNGKLVAVGVLRDKGEIETLGLDEAIWEAHRMLNKNNYNYDHIKVSFLTVNVSVEKLERML